LYPSEIDGKDYNKEIINPSNINDVCILPMDQIIVIGLEVTKPKVKYNGSNDQFLNLLDLHINSIELSFKILNGQEEVQLEISCIDNEIKSNSLIKSMLNSENKQTSDIRSLLMQDSDSLTHHYFTDQSLFIFRQISIKPPKEFLNIPLQLKLLLSLTLSPRLGPSSTQGSAENDIDEGKSSKNNFFDEKEKNIRQVMDLNRFRPTPIAPREVLTVIRVPSPLVVHSSVHELDQFSSFLVVSVDKKNTRKSREIKNIRVHLERTKPSNHSLADLDSDFSVSAFEIAPLEVDQLPVTIGPMESFNFIFKVKVKQSAIFSEKFLFGGNMMGKFTTPFTLFWQPVSEGNIFDSENKLSLTEEKNNLLEKYLVDYWNMV
jgi:hypothetical protein